MSAKKSFDVQHKKAEAPKRGARKRKVVDDEPAPKRRKSLRAKREEARSRKSSFFLILFLLCCGLLVFGLWQPEVRITTVHADETPDKEGIEAIAGETLTGNRYYILPKNSFFLYSEREMREAILNAYPSISSLSIHRTGFTEVSITASSRAAAFLWCGEPQGAEYDTTCYETDAEGFVFREFVGEEGTSLLQVYATLDTASSTGSYPLRAKVEGASKLPDILRFARAVSSLGIPLRAVAIRGDEADLYSAGGTRITYVVGKESEAARIAEAAFLKLNFMDGSIEYVDLRFGGKAYVKRN